MTFELSFLDTMVGYITTLRHRLIKSSPIAGSFRVGLRAQDVASRRKIEFGPALSEVYARHEVSRPGAVPVAKA